MKNAESLEDKLDALLNSHLMIADDVDLEGKNILLVDDLYNLDLRCSMLHDAEKCRMLSCFWIDFSKIFR